MRRSATAQQAAPTKLAYVNVRAVLQQTPEYVKAESLFAKELEGYRAQVAKMQAQLDSASAEFEQQSVLLSPSARNAKRKELEDKAAALQQQTQTMQQQAAARERELLDPIQSRVSASDRRDPGRGQLRDDLRRQQRERHRRGRQVARHHRQGPRPTESAQVAVAARPALSVQAVADLVGGRLIGDGALLLSGVRPLESASETELSFLVSPRYVPYFRASRAGAVLLGEAHAGEAGGPPVRIVVPDVARALEQVVLAFVPPPPSRPGIDPAARIAGGAVVAADASIGPWSLVGEGATIGARSRIGSGVVIGDGVIVGDDCVIDDHVVCYPGAVLGDRVMLKAGAVIAGPGFGFASDRQGHRRITAHRPLRARGRRRGGLGKLPGPGHARGHRDRPRHQDRQPGADRAIMCGSASAAW